MSDTPKQDDMDSSELERQLAGLAPLALDESFTNELLRDQKRVSESTPEAKVTQLHWKRLIPVSLAACLVMTAYVAFRFGDASSGQEVAQQVETESAPVVASTPAGKNATGAAQPGFVPVSSEGYLLKTSSGGIKQSESGPVEELNLEYQDVYHWRDSKTKTNIRFFTPRSEKVLVPVITN